ncbi:hypothetical protein [Bradyrhizobium oligotrophicum]
MGDYFASLPSDFVAFENTEIITFTVRCWFLKALTIRNDFH